MSDNLVRRLRTREPYKSDVQIMVEMLGPDPPIIVLGQGDYPTAVDIADRVTRDMNEAADRIEALTEEKERLRQQLETARVDALEDAVKVLREWSDKVEWSRNDEMEAFHQVLRRVMIGQKDKP